MKRRYIFDEDYTLLIPDWTKTDQYFIDKFGEKAKTVMDNIGPVLRKYERKFRRYDYKDLATYLRDATELPVTPKDMRIWDELVAVIDDTVDPHAKEVLEYLKSKGDSIAVLTNWFGESQKERLMRAGLYDYIDAFYSGDIITKPHKEAYWMAAGGVDPLLCYVVGDDTETDYIAPKAVGMNAILVDRKDVHHKTLVKVRSLDEIKNRR